MKRKPEKNYKLPKYAAGLAALLFTGGLTGCTDPVGEVQLSGDVPFVDDTTEQSPEPEGFAGAVDTAETCSAETDPVPTEEAAQPTPAPTEEIALAGDIVME